MFHLFPEALIGVSESGFLFSSKKILKKIAWWFQKILRKKNIFIPKFFTIRRNLLIQTFIERKYPKKTGTFFHLVQNILHFLGFFFSENQPLLKEGGRRWWLHIAKWNRVTYLYSRCDRIWSIIPALRRMYQVRRYFLRVRRYQLINFKNVTRKQRFHMVTWNNSRFPTL